MRCWSHGGWARLAHIATARGSKAVNLSLPNYTWPPLSIHSVHASVSATKMHMEVITSPCLYPSLFPFLRPCRFLLGFSHFSYPFLPYNSLAAPPISPSLGLSPPLCVSQMKWLILSFPLPVAPLTLWKGRATPLTMSVLFWQRQIEGERGRKRPCRLWRA